MRRNIIVLVIAVLASFEMVAQDYYSVQTISDYRYYGTARSIGLGNAVTALGGDLGMIGINPAGSVVAPYSQIAISPGISISSSISRYASQYDMNQGLQDSDFGTATRSGLTRFVMPNIGFNFYFNTGRNYGIQGISFGFTSNATSNNIRSQVASGSNNETSLLGSLGYWASGVPLSTYLDLNAYNNYDLGFFSVMAAKTGMIQTYGATNNVYQGATEIINSAGNLVTAGPLNQKSSVTSAGYRNDLIVNFAMKINNDWYVGINLGVPREITSYQESFVETAEKIIDYPDFDSASYTYYMSRRVSGVYAKLGVIWAPVQGLRLGAAVQSPTAYTVLEDYSISGHTRFRNSSGYSSSGSRDNEYCLRSPYMMNFGAAYVFGSVAMLSVDYEFADYKITRYGLIGRSGFNDGEFAIQNTTNRLFYGMEHNLRAGFEFKVIPSVAVRAGFNLKTSPMRYYTGSDGSVITASNFDYYSYDSGLLTLNNKQSFKSNVIAFSLGAGWSGGGAFFCDAAVRMNRMSKQDFVPYSDYIFNADNTISVPTPTVRTSQNVWDIVATVGWRF